MNLTKHKFAGTFFAYTMPRSILLAQTKDPVYIEKRKQLSGAFFKSKLVGMTKIIKEVALKEIKTLQEQKTCDLAQFTIGLQARIIVNTTVGMGQSQRQVEWEKEDGSTEMISIAETMGRLNQFATMRSQLLINVIFPELLYYAIAPSDRRHSRNNDSLRAVLQSIIDERRGGSTKAYGDDGRTDLL